MTGKRFIVRSDEKLSAFVELERQTNCDSVGCGTPKFSRNRLRGV